MGHQQKRTCTVEGCEKFVWGRGLCSTHYQRWRLKGDPTIEPERQRTGGRPPLATRCAVEGCDGVGPYTRGHCRPHYERLKKYGDPLGEPYIANQQPCIIDGCDSNRHARGLCIMHYARLRDHGDPGEATPRRKSAGEGHVSPDGYHRLTVNGKHKKAHRHVMEQVLGRELLPNENVHHRNGIKNDNRPENLELWVVNQPRGQRVDDLVAFVVEHYRHRVLAAL